MGSIRGVAALMMAVVVGTLAAAAEPTPGYAIVVSEATHADPGWLAVVTTLETKHRQRGSFVVTWRESPAEVVPRLAATMPRHACFVARPEEAGRAFVAEVHRLTRRLDEDPYTDLFWGILTGFDAANAHAIAATAAPLTIRRVTAGTEVALDRVESGEWYSELERGHLVRKEPGQPSRTERGPEDTTAALAGRLSAGLTDLFVTSGHATERDWQIGYAYRNGAFRSRAGQLVGIDTAGTTIPIASSNPKVWLPVGNCLAGHIDGPDALALAFMHSAGVRQMIGYTVPTWFGYAGWGVLDYFLEQPGRFTLCEAFHANGHALVHRLEDAGDAREARGLRFDRDAVAFYGDPAWEVRLAPGPLQFEQTLVEADGVFTLTIAPRDGPRSFAPVNTNGSQRGGRPIVHFLPRRLDALELVAGSDWRPVLTDTFVLVPLPPANQQTPLRVVFRGRPAASR